MASSIGVCEAIVESGRLAKDNTALRSISVSSYPSPGLMANPELKQRLKLLMVWEQKLSIPARSCRLIRSFEIPEHFSATTSRQFFYGRQPLTSSTAALKPSKICRLAAEPIGEEPPLSYIDGHPIKELNRRR
jgi:hypothetical protein